MKTAIVTGVTGQDGAYLAKFLLDKGYKVIGAMRRSASDNTWRIRKLQLTQNSQFTLAEFDLTDPISCISLIKDFMPDELYNLAAQNFVSTSFTQPVITTNITGLGTLHLLEAIKIVKPDVKFYQASTSEMYGKVQETPQSENTPFYPKSPYGIAKLYAHWITINYRESNGIYATSGILFNHESPLRGEEFVTRKITTSISKLKRKKIEKFSLGNMNALRDWGY